MTSVVFVVMDAVAIDAADFRFCLLLGNAVVVNAAVHRTFQVGIAEYFHHFRVVFQYEVGTTAYDDARFLSGELLYNPTFGHEQYVVCRKAGFHWLFAVL